MSFLNAVTTFFRTTFSSNDTTADASAATSQLPKARRGYVYCLRGFGSQREGESLHPFACIQTLNEKDRTYIGISVCSAGKPRRKHDQFSRKTARLLAQQRVCAAQEQSPACGPYYGSFAQDDVLRAAALATFFAEIARPSRNGSSKITNWSRRAQEKRLHTLCEQLGIPYRCVPQAPGGGSDSGAKQDGATAPVSPGADAAVQATTVVQASTDPSALPDPLEPIRQTSAKMEEVLRRFAAMRESTATSASVVSAAPAQAAPDVTPASADSLAPEDVVSVVTNPLNGTVDLQFRDGSSGTVHARTHYLVPMEMSAADFNNVRIEDGCLRWCSASAHWSRCSKYRMYALAHKLPEPYLDLERAKNRETVRSRMDAARAASTAATSKPDEPTALPDITPEPTRSGWSGYDYDSVDGYYCD